MRHPILISELLREGRNLRLSMMIIFYNAILAFVAILFLLFNAESYQGNLYSYSPYRTQFFIISLIQFLAIFIIMPFLVGSAFSHDRDQQITDQFAMIPDFATEYIYSKFMLVLMEFLLINFSALPILSMYCMYSGISWKEVGRLMIMLALFTFWAASISIFSFSVFSKSFQAFAANVLVLVAFFLGTLVSVELIAGVNTFAASGLQAAPVAGGLILLFLALNPISSGLGYYVSITGNNGLVGSYCSHLGIDNTSTLFIFLFYKAAGFACLVTGLVFLSLAIWKMQIERRL